MLNNLKVKAQTLKTFLNDKGYKVKSTECLEAVSHIESGNCYNIAKNKAIRILKPGERLTFKDMKKTDFNIDVVISMDMEVMVEGIEAVNDISSEMITGSEYALCDIGYEVYPYFYGDGGVAIRVTGYIIEHESLSHLEDYEEEEYE
jgi:CheY-like chemotaxis protein